MNIENQKEIKIKILTLGDFAVGKTSFITKFIDNKFSEVYLSTIGVDFKFKTQVLPNGKKVKIQFIDTAGQERYRSIAYNMIKNADGILLMYDITRKETFDNVSNWIENIRENKISNFPIILIGNKSDLENERQVTKEEGEAKSKELGLLFFETSNKDGINIEETTIEPRAFNKSHSTSSASECADSTSVFSCASLSLSMYGRKSNERAIIYPP